MNAGKLVAQIAVLAIVVYCCYGAIVTSLPMSADEINQLKENPFEVEAPSFSGNCDGMNFNMTVSGGKVISHLPASVADVFLTLYLGSGPLKMEMGTIDLGTLVPHEDTVIDGAVSVPVYAVLAYATITESDEGTMALPLCFQIGFKYFEWKGAYLLDLKVTIKNTIPFEGTVPSIEVDGNDAKVHIELDSTDGGMILDAADSLKSEYPEYFESTGANEVTASLRCGDAVFEISINTDSSDPVIGFVAKGDTTKTAVDLLRESINDDGTLDLTLLGAGSASDMPMPALDKDNVDVFIKVIEMMYNMGSGTP